MTSTVPRRGTRHRGLRALVITVLVLVVLLVVADRVGVLVADRVAGDTLQRSQHLPSRPDVDIEGIPFLTQLASGNFDEIAVTATGVPIGQDPHLLDLSRIHVVFDTIHVARDLSSVHAQTAHATASVTYSDLSKALGIDVEYQGNGRIRAAKNITLLGQTIDASISAAPRLVNGALAFGAPTIDGLSGLGRDVVDALHKIFALDIPLRGFPFGVQVRSLAVNKQGLAILLTGSDLTYTR